MSPRARTGGLSGRRRNAVAHDPVLDVAYERCSSCSSTWPRSAREQWGWTACPNCGAHLAAIVSEQVEQADLPAKLEAAQ